MKKIIVGTMAILLGACSAFQSTEVKKEHDKAFNRMYCAAVHQEIGNLALQEFKRNNDTYAEDSAATYYQLSGIEVQHSVMHFHKATLKKPFDIFEYNDAQNNLGKNYSLEDLSKEMGYGDAVAQGRNEVQTKYQSLAKSSNPFIFDDLDEHFGDQCDDALAEDGEDFAKILSTQGEAKITVEMTGQCVGFFSSISTLAAEQGNENVARNTAHHAGLMQALMFSYMNDTNSEAAYDKMAQMEDRIYNKQMTDAEVSKQIESCAGVYRTANQYAVETLVNQ